MPPLGTLIATRDEKLGPDRRIKHRQDFLRIQGSGEKFRTRNLLLITCPRPPGEQSRIGITVTTKVHKRAVQRNRLKRRLRELFRKERRNFRKTVDIVVIALDGATEMDFLQLAKQFKFLLYRSGILPEKRGRQSKKRPAGV